MNVYDSLQDLPRLTNPCLLTIGNFDGIHLGHQTLMSQLVREAHANGRAAVVFSFSNHPSEVLRPDSPTLKVCTPNQKAFLLEALHVDLLIMVRFTQEFANQTAEDFLATIQEKLPFEKILLGYDARIGRHREGNQEEVRRLAKKMGFEVEYLDPVSLDDQPISSTRIRKHIQEGQFETAETLLGRRYALWGRVEPGEARGARLGFPTANIGVKGLCLPPMGVYAVRLRHKGEILPGVANLGIAPTFGQKEQPVLEVHLLEKTCSLYEEEVEVTFEKFLRPEKKFASSEELKQQIARDVEQARSILNA